MKAYRDLSKAINKIILINSSAFGETRTIQSWVEQIRQEIEKNRKYLDIDDIYSKLYILKIFLRDMVLKGVSGETGKKIESNLNKYLKSMDDLNIDNYEYILKISGHRFPKDYIVWDKIVNAVSEKFNWEWKKYIENAENNYTNNFDEDPFLIIHGIGPNVRNLALSNFSPHFPKIDSHIGEVFQRLEIDKLILQRQIPKSWWNTSKLQPIFVQIAKHFRYEYSETDLDRIFWHFGRQVCSKSPKCYICPIIILCGYDMKLK